MKTFVYKYDKYYFYVDKQEILPWFKYNMLVPTVELASKFTEDDISHSDIDSCLLEETNVGVEMYQLDISSSVRIIHPFKKIEIDEKK